MTFMSKISDGFLWVAVVINPNKRQHTGPAALDSQQVARLCGVS